MAIVSIDSSSDSLYIALEVNNEIFCKSYPDLRRADKKLLDGILEIMDELLEDGLKGTPDVVSRKLASMACKAAVKGNMQMSTHEAEALIMELFTLENPYHCPHGRPTMISMSRYEIETKFKRIL